MAKKMKPFKHLKVISKHKWAVMKGCFRVGLYKQGLLHDLSKYGPAEFWIGARYFQGTRSPNVAEREEKGYSSAWLHHKGRNKHHYEYWVEFSGKKGLILAKIPTRYVVEAFIDRVAASKIYRKEKYVDSDPLNYYLNGNPGKFIHEESRALLESLLYMLAEKGEKETFSYIKHTVLKQK